MGRKKRYVSQARKRQISYMYYTKHMSFREIARELGTYDNYVSRIIKSMPAPKSKHEGIGVNCTNEIMAVCIYGHYLRDDERCCDYLSIVGHRRPCDAHDCTCFVDKHTQNGAENAQNDT